MRSSSVGLGSLWSCLSNFPRCCTWFWYTWNWICVEGVSVFQSSLKCKKCRIDNLASHGEEPGRNTFDTALLFSSPVPQIDSGNNMPRSFGEFSGLSKIGTPFSVSEFAIFFDSLSNPLVLMPIRHRVHNFSFAKRAWKICFHQSRYNFPLFSDRFDFVLVR